MKIPTILGLIDRRILVNYQVEPEVLQRVLPDPFRPLVVRGRGLAGICLIRLTQVRPAGLPAWVGIASENAAHRVAVEWDEQGETRQGVYVERRDTDSWLNSLAGGRIFPGEHHHARFVVEETERRWDVALRSDDGQTTVAVSAEPAERLSKGSIFADLQECSRFFEAGSLGYSATGRVGQFQGLELRCLRWQAEPLGVRHVSSSFFDDLARFPAGSVRFDSALLMRGIPHQWHERAELCCPTKAG